MLEKFQEILGYKSKKAYRKPKKRALRNYIGIIGLVILLTLLINKFLILKVNIPTASMAPTLNINDKLLVLKTNNLDCLNFGDIIVFYSDEFQEYMAKRLIGLPGDKIKIEKGNLYVNGVYRPEKYVKNEDYYNGEFNVPDGQYFFLGDNRRISLDSRLWSKTYIDGQDIIGVVKFRLYPFKDIGSIK